MVLLTLFLSEHLCDTTLPSVNHGLPWFCGHGCFSYFVLVLVLFCFFLKKKKRYVATLMCSVMYGCFLLARVLLPVPLRASSLLVGKCVFGAVSCISAQHCSLTRPDTVVSLLTNWAVV